MSTTTPCVIPEPHAVAEDGRVLASRLMAVDCDGLLVSPVRGTPWTRRAMRAHAWDEGSLVTGRAGLHAVAYQPDARPVYADYVVAHVLCDGCCAFSVGGSHGLRAERMEIISLVVVADRALARALHARYGVPVRVLRHCQPRNGRLVLLDSVGTVFVERRRDGRRHGRWERRCADGTVIVERYRDGKLHGRREERWPDGRRIVEYWRSNQLYGRREEHWPSGTVIVEHWRDGLLVHQTVRLAAQESVSALASVSLSVPASESVQRGRKEEL